MGHRGSFDKVSLTLFLICFSILLYNAIRRYVVGAEGVPFFIFAIFFLFFCLYKIYRVFADRKKNIQKFNER